MTKEEALNAITHLSGVIGWLQHFLETRTRHEDEDREVEDMLYRLLAIRESIRRDDEAQNKARGERAEDITRRRSQSAKDGWQIRRAKQKARNEP